MIASPPSLSQAGLISPLAPGLRSVQRLASDCPRPSLIRARVSAGQIEGAIRGRVKDLKLGFVERISSLFILETTREIQRLTHDLQIARLSGLPADDGAVLAARAAMAKLQEALGEVAR